MEERKRNRHPHRPDPDSGRDGDHGLSSVRGHGHRAPATELSVSYIDHNTLQTGFENADDHRYLLSVARSYGIRLSRAGNGICHQVHLERFGKPGATLLGSDSHTPTGGGIGMAAIGAGGLDVALAMGGAPFYLPCPEVIRIVMKGNFGPWVSAKDLVLKMLEKFGTKGNVGRIFEYAGPGLASLSCPSEPPSPTWAPSAASLPRSSPATSETRDYLRSQGREADWKPLAADPDADYAMEVEMDLGELEPLAAAPHSPGNVVPVRSLASVKVDQVCIGSCTNSSYSDLATAALMLRGPQAAARDQPRRDARLAPGGDEHREGRLPRRFHSGGRPPRRAFLLLLHRQRPGPRERRGVPAQLQPQLRGPLGHGRRAGLPGEPGDRGRFRHPRPHRERPRPRGRARR